MDEPLVQGGAASGSALDESIDVRDLAPGPAEILVEAKEAVGGSSHKAIKKLYHNLKADPENENITAAIAMAEAEEDANAASLESIISSAAAADPPAATQPSSSVPAPGFTVPAADEANGEFDVDVGGSTAPQNGLQDLDELQEDLLSPGEARGSVWMDLPGGHLTRLSSFLLDLCSSSSFL